MQQRLKRWESPRKRGRNDKGKGGSARARQIRKQQKMLRQQLKNNSDNQSSNNQSKRSIKEGEYSSSFFFLTNSIVAIN